MNTCEKCGEQVPEEKAFCPNCGNSMTPERQRTQVFSEEMSETEFGFNRSVKNPPLRQPSSPSKPKATPKPKE